MNTNRVQSDLLPHRELWDGWGLHPKQEKKNSQKKSKEISLALIAVLFYNLAWPTLEW